jgi:hypothetical protein
MGAVLLGDSKIGNQQRTLPPPPPPPPYRQPAGDVAVIEPSRLRASTRRWIRASRVKLDAMPELLPGVTIFRSSAAALLLACPCVNEVR